MAGKGSNTPSTAASAAVNDAAGGLLQGINATQDLLKNDYAGAYAFWHSDDNGLIDPVTGQVTPVKVSLSSVLEQAIANKYLQSGDATNFMNLLKTSDWYQKYGGQGLSAAEAFYTNNPNYTSALNLRKTDIQNMATQAGYKLSDKVVNDLATGSMYTAFDGQIYSSQAYQTSLASQIAQAAVHYNVPLTGGKGLDNTTALKNYAQSMGVQVGDNYINSAAQAINDPSSQATLQTYQQHLRDMAASQYSGFAPLIQKGMTMQQIADPYVQAMATNLEIDPNSIDFTKDPTIQKALGTTIGPDGTAAPTSMWQFQQNLRQDPRWQYTNNARDTVTGIAHGILKDFGVAT